MTHQSSMPRDGDSDDKRALLAGLLQKQLNDAQLAIPMTHSQQAMWFLQQIAPESGAYNVAFAARVRSEVDERCLQRSLQKLVDRHAPLRTTYSVQDGSPVQNVHARFDLTLETVDVSGYDDSTLYTLVDRAHRAPFDLEHGPVMRATLYTRSDTEHVLLLAAHHIAIDGSSVWILLEELSAFYAAETSGIPATLPDLATHYPDYTRWLNDRMDGPDGERMWMYWKEQLAGDLPVLDLPTDRQRPALQTFNGSSVTIDIDALLENRIRAFARAEQTTPYVVLLSAFQIMLHRYSGQDTILVGSPMAGRSRPELAGLVGDFFNSVVLRGDLSGSPDARNYVAQVRATVLAALNNQDFPFALLVQRLAPRPDPSRSPIFQAMINLLNAPRSSRLVDLFVPQQQGVLVDVGGLQMEAYPISQQEGQLDLGLQIVDANHALYGRFQYNTDLFDAPTIERMAGHFRTILEGMLDNPDCSVANLPLMRADERNEVIKRWNSTSEAYPSHLTLHNLVEAQANRTPDAVAVQSGNQSLTYAQLNLHATQLAQHLQGAGIGRGDLVAITLERSCDLPVALLAVLKSGAAYLPLNPAFPAERIGYILQDSGATALIGTTGTLPDIDLGDLHLVLLDEQREPLVQEAGNQLASNAEPDDLAYVIYTSGSTGRPKGVEIQHRALVNFVSTMRRQPGLAADDVLLAVTTVAFDMSVLDLYLPLVVGARLVLAPYDTVRDGRELTALLKHSQATVVQATPVTFRMLLKHGRDDLRGIKCLCGGEAMPVDLARELLDAGVELWNMYGPTESTVWSTVQRVQSVESTSVPVGKPVGNTEVYVLDGAQQLVPAGVVGELYIGGHGLARGYRNRPELTAERFVPHAFSCEPDARLYRTGDLARYGVDGTLHVLGRTDQQVKVRGFRIEPGEIESILLRHPAISETVVVARTDAPNDVKLVAYVVGRDSQAPGIGELRSILRVSLPDYMIPSAFVFLECLPRNHSGKVDRLALPAPLEQRTELRPDFRAPQTATEKAIASSFQTVLGTEHVSLFDNFFDLGGHSLQLAEALSHIEDRLHVRLKPADAQLNNLGQLAAVADEMIDRGEVTEPAPSPSLPGMLTGAMRRMISARQGAR